MVTSCSGRGGFRHIRWARSPIDNVAWARIPTGASPWEAGQAINPAPPSARFFTAGTTRTPRPYLPPVTCRSHGAAGEHATAALGISGAYAVQDELVLQPSTK